MLALLRFFLGGRGGALLFFLSSEDIPADEREDLLKHTAALDSRITQERT